MDRTGNPFVDDLLVEKLQIDDGYLILSDAPGLGIEIDAAVLARLTMPAGQPIPDGAYSDMSFGKAYDFVIPPYHTQVERQ
jgi:hypothetical protein